MFFYGIHPNFILLVSIKRVLMYKIKIFEPESQQIKYLIKVVAFFWLITKIWSYKTWITDRAYPVVPPLDFLKHIPDFLHLFFFGFSLLVLLMVVFLKENRLLLISLFFSELLSCSLDTVRLQPWEFTYMCIILIIIINFHRPKNILLLVHIFLVSIYLFSGLHKLNREFLSSVWMNMILVDFFGFSIDVILRYKLFFAGLIIPVIELLLAVLLFACKSKRKISYLLILIHSGILIFLGPFGLKYNSIVWIWNLALIFILLIVYIKPIESVNKNFYKLNFYWLILWFVMPVFSFFGSWYQYFSSNLYSGRGYQMYICFSEKEEDLKPYFESEANNICKEEPCINLQNWALKEIKSTPIPEFEIYREIGIYMKKKYAGNKLKIRLYHPATQKMMEL